MKILIDTVERVSNHLPEEAPLPIYDLTPFTMLDYPDHTACIIWFAGCNMRCDYCHNPQIVKGKGLYSEEWLLNFLKSRRGLLDAVVFSGGEASRYKNLIDLSFKIKKMGFKIKLDTNGSNPKLLKEMLKQGLLNYVALDYKATQEKFIKITHSNHYKKLNQSLEVLCHQKNIEFEVRTTVHSSQLNSGDINQIITTLENHHYTGTYHIQNFKNNNPNGLLGSFSDEHNPLCKHDINKTSKFKINYRNFD